MRWKALSFIAVFLLISVAFGNMGVDVGSAVDEEEPTPVPGPGEPGEPGSGNDNGPEPTDEDIYFRADDSACNYKYTYADQLAVKAGGQATEVDNNNGWFYDNSLSLSATVRSVESNDDINTARIGISAVGRFEFNETRYGGLESDHP